MAHEPCHNALLDGLLVNHIRSSKNNGGAAYSIPHVGLSVHFSRLHRKYSLFQDNVIPFRFGPWPICVCPSFPCSHPETLQKLPSCKRGVNNKPIAETKLARRAEFLCPRSHVQQVITERNRAFDKRYILTNDFIDNADQVIPVIYVYYFLGSGSGSKCGDSQTAICCLCYPPIHHPRAGNEIYSDGTSDGIRTCSLSKCSTDSFS